MNVVLDASAVLALVIGEPGADKVLARLSGAAISAVNFAEVGTRLADLGRTLETISEDLRLLALDVVAFDEDAATSAIELREATRKAGLSVGDRACIALAMREGAVAPTADRSWASIGLNCEIELIR